MINFRALKFLFITPIVVGSIFFLSIAVWAGDDLKTIEQKAQYLGFMRRHYPALYNDFVVRIDAIDFLDRAQEAIDQIHFNGERITGLDFSVSDVSSTEFEAGQFEASELDLISFEKDLNKFISSYSNSSTSVGAALTHELIKASLLEGLTSGLMHSKLVPQMRELLQKPMTEQLNELANILEPLAKIPGLDPQRIGINQVSLSGHAFLDLYKEAVQGQQNSLRLVFLALLSQYRSGQLSLHLNQMPALISSVSSQEFLNLFELESFRKHSATLAHEIVEGVNSPNLNFAKAVKIFKQAHQMMKSIVMMKVDYRGQAVLLMKRGHPYELFLRGSVGDCSTDKSFALSLASKEEMYWIYGGKSVGDVKGYLQYTRVLVDGEPTLYVHTISGADISRRDTRRALLALFDSLKELGASRIVLPVSDKIREIINYPEVATAFEEMNKVGRRVEIHYLDVADRQSLAPFTDGSLDLPETNQFGIEITREHVSLPNLKTVVTRSERFLKDILKPLNREEVLLIALDLRSRETNSQSIEKFLQAHKLSTALFENLWETLSNKERAPIEMFHSRVQNTIRRLGISVEWEKFKHSPVLFRGHFAASDALHGANSELAIEYIRTYLLSFTNLDHVYKTLAPHFSELISNQKFVDIVHTLFRKNSNEMNRILDFYELEEKSAYRTLANLFLSGLNPLPFANETAQLERPLEDAQEIQERKDGIFVRRVTLLGMIHRYQEKYFIQLITHLEGIASSGRQLDVDDIRNAAQYFSAFTDYGGASQAQIQRMNHFLMSSSLGIRFAQALGMYKIDRLDIPRYFTFLIKAGQPALAAHLIHKDPWPSHRLAPQWLRELWNYREQIDHSLLIEGLVVTPSWQKVDGADRLIDWLMARARDNLGNEVHMTSILLRQPEKLSPIRLKWLAQVSSRDLATEIIKSMNMSWPKAKALWLDRQLEKRFGGLVRSESVLETTKFRCEALF